MESTLSLYKIFYTVANTQNISRASRELYISQPAHQQGHSETGTVAGRHPVLPEQPGRHPDP